MSARRLLTIEQFFAAIRRKGLSIEPAGNARRRGTGWLVEIQCGEAEGDYPIFTGRGDTVEAATHDAYAQAGRRWL